MLQDPTGALNPRRTVYEAVAEGLRIHRVRGNERDLVAEALSLAGLRPPERFFHRYPHELSGGQRQRVVIAGALVLKPDGDRRRRAGVLTGRLGARRDPRAAAAPARRARPRGAGGHARPRPGVEHRRPARGHVPRPDHRDRHDRGGAGRAEAPVHRRRCCRCCPSRSHMRAGRSWQGEPPDPTPDPERLPVQPALPGARWTARAERAGITQRLPHRASLPVLPARWSASPAACLLHPQHRRSAGRQLAWLAEPSVRSADGVRRSSSATSSAGKPVATCCRPGRSRWAPAAGC